MTFDGSRYDQQYEEVETNNGGGSREKIPTATFQVKVDTVAFQITKAGNDMLVWTLTITNPGKWQGRKMWRQNMLTESGMKWLKIDLEMCKFNYPPSQFEAHLKELLDLELEVNTIENEGPYTNPKNVYFQKLIETTGGVPNEDIPF